MADVSISSLTQGIPAGNNIVPYSTGTNTLGVPVSAIFQGSDKIGIGISNPQFTLDLTNTADTGERAIRIFNGSLRDLLIGVEGSSANRFLGSSINNAFVGSSSPAGLELATNNSVRMYINSDGNVGIGTTTPDTKLHVNGTIKAAAITLTAFNKAILSDVKAVATPGGDATRDYWNKRTLNTKTDPGNIVTLSNDQFTLGAGKYVVNASAPAYRTHEHQIRLYRVGAAAGVVQYGTVEFSNYGGGYAQTRSFLCCLLDIAENTTYQIEHWVSFRSGVTETLGITNLATSGAPAIFTTVEITKI
jgi:hypothetical protein